VARSEDIVLLPFRESNPSRRIAMAWRKSSAMGGFLAQLAQVFRQLPPELFSPDPDLAGFRPGRDAGPVEPEARRG
jgi:LysR family hydrogen peroxide-inducible transcriptional activator